MNKTFTINISGIIFNIEEDAFEKLNNYIGLLEHIFECQAGGQEILQDIESRIAELLQEKITEGQEAVTSIWVDEVIQRMGTPEEMTDQEQMDNSSGSRTEIKQEKIKKRMYRDGEGRVLGGVCSGMGAYFNLDPVFIRILFVILAFLGVGISILIYLILWIVVPEAKTTAQRLEMRGEEATISNIRKAIQEEVTEVKESFSKMNKSEAVQEGKNLAKKAGNALSKVVYAIKKLFRNKKTIKI
jgi:phage shock protein PspC (stress-responsive transcriptional regulator)